MKKLLLATFVIITLSAGCSLLRKDTGAELSPAGLRPEMFFPEETVFVASIDYRQEEVRKQLEEITNLFAQRDGESILDAMRQAFIKGLSEQGYTYETDIKPIVSEGTRFVFGFENGETIDNLLNKSEKQTGSVYIGFEIGNIEKFDAFAKALEQRGEVTSKTYRGFTFYEGKKETTATNQTTPDTQIQETPQEIDADSNSKNNAVAVQALQKHGCIARVKDIGLLASNCALMEAAIDRGLKDKKNLNNKTNFQKVLYELPQQYFGLVYIEGGTLTSLLKNKALEGIPGKNIVGAQNRSEAMVAQGLTLTLGKEQIVLSGYQYADETKLQGKRLKDFYSQSNLISEISGENIIFFTEAANLKDTISTYLERLNGKRNINGASAQGSIENTLRALGLDLEEDIFSWMNEGYAFAVHGNENRIIPGITLVVDTDKNSKAALRTVEVLDAQIQSLIAALRLRGGEEIKDAIQKTDEGTIHTVTLDLSKEQGSIAGLSTTSILLTQPLTVTYGVTSDNRFVISTMDDFIEKYGNKTLPQNEKFQNIASQLGLNKKATTYFNGENLYDYLERLKELSQEEEQQKNIAQFMQLIKSVEQAIFSTKTGNTEVWIEGLIELKSN